MAGASDAENGLSESARRAFARLRAQFIDGLPARWTEIESAVGGSRIAALHRLAGAAGSYGLQALGDAARAAEADGGQADSLAAVRRAMRNAGATVP